MSIGAVRMHRGLADRAPLDGPQAGIVGAKERSIKTAVRFTSSSPPSYSEEGTYGTGAKAFASVRLFGGKQDDGSPGNETV
jgi:hypothetical protein